MPILCSSRPTLNPGVSRSTTKQDRFRWRLPAGSVTANTVTRSATLPWLMNRFVPSIT